MHINLFGESQFYNASVQLGLLLKYAGFRKDVFRESCFNSEFQRTHIIQMFGASQFYDASFLLGFF